jgi:hypothetical protein
MVNKFKVGDTVRWVVPFCDSMTYWDKYVVNNTYNCIDGSQSVYVIDDNGQTHCWAGWRFTLATPDPKPKPSTYTVTWVAPRKEGYTSLIDGELSFGTKEEAVGFACLFKDDVNVKVTED